MRSIRFFSKLGILVALLMFSIVCGPMVAADHFVGTTYFEKASVGFNSFISSSQDGSNSAHGAVLPNWDPTIDTTTGAGALGTKALGISGSTSNQARKQALYDFLWRKNHDGSDWEKMGSALIIHEMSGKPWGAGGRTIPSDDQEWDELKARLVNNSKVQMIHMSYDKTNNTAGVWANGKFDAIPYVYDDDGLVDSWVFAVNGTPVYALEIICGNPLGTLPGLPPAPYGLTPSTSLTKSFIEPGDSVTVTNTVSNGSDVSSGETDWYLTQLEFKPGTNLSGTDLKGRDGDSDACSTFTSAGRLSCQVVQKSLKVIFNANSPKIYNPSITYTASANVAIGTRICFTTSVSPPTDKSSPSWRHAKLACVVIGKKPKVQIWGGDVRVGDIIDTSTSTFSSPGRTYGSWGEYGAISNKSNSGFASGAGLNKGSKDIAQAAWSDLTFANTGGGSCLFGCYGFTSYAPSLVGQFTSSASSLAIAGDQNLSDLASGTYRTGNLRITGGTISPDRSIVIVATGTVTIAGDITYSDGPYTSVRDIPQVIIRAPKVNIAGSVGSIDAWLLATTPDGTGVLNTCSDVATTARLTADICNNPLRVNGPVVTDRLYLRRTAGSGGAMATLDQPAETFDLRADAYLWGAGYGDGSAKVRTVYTKELPPRF